jgi:hypothetical protein
MDNLKDVEIIVKDPVVYVAPNTLFNAIQTYDYFKAIAQAAEGLDYWVLFEYPLPNNTMNTLTVRQLFEQYKQLTTHGCSAIVLQIDQAIARILLHPEIHTLGVPFLASRNPIEIAGFVNEQVTNIEMIRLDKGLHRN